MHIQSCGREGSRCCMESLYSLLSVSSKKSTCSARIRVVASGESNVAHFFLIENKPKTRQWISNLSIGKVISVTPLRGRGILDIPAVRSRSSRLAGIWTLWLCNMLGCLERLSSAVRDSKPQRWYQSRRRNSACKGGTVKPGSS